MAIQDANLMFTGRGTSGYSPTLAQDNVAPFSIDTAPLTLPTGSGGGSTPGYNAGSNTNAGRDMGLGGEIWLEVLVAAAVAQSANNATFKLVTDSTATITTVTTLVASTAFAAATLIAGFIFRVRPPQALTYQRYLGFCVTITTTAWTAGTVEAKLLLNVQASDLYQGGFTVS